MSRRFILSLLLSLFYGGIVSSLPPEEIKLSLDEAVSMALKNNTNIINSELDLEISKKRIWETIAQGLPHVDIKASYQHLFVVPTISLPGNQLSNTSIPFDPATGAGTISQLQLASGETIYLNNVPGMPIPLGVKNNISADFTVSQLIFNGTFFVGLQATKVYHELTRNNTEKTRLDVIETVVNTYHMIQMAEESRRILNQNMDNINKTLSDVTEMNKQGFVEITDVDQLEVTSNTIRNALNQINSNLDMGYRLLKIQLGMQDTTVLSLADEMEPGDTLVQSSMQLISQEFDLSRNVDYKLIQSSEKVAHIDLKLAQSRFLPSINAFYNHNEQLNAAAFNLVPKDLIGVNLNFPIFSSGERLAVMSQRRMALKQAQNTEKLVANSLKMQASEYRNDVKLKLERYLNQKKNKELSDAIYQRTLEKYKQGMASSMDLMNTQNQYLTNLTNYYQSIFDLQNSRARLKKMFNINDEGGEK